MSLVSSFFVTATGTDVGKTIISAALLDAAQRRGQARQYWKPVQTGGTDVDLQAIESLLERPVASPLPTLAYKLPASPDQAAEAEQARPPSVAELMRAMEGHSDPALVIEGAGGLLVPLNEQNETWIDFLVTAQLPVVLVAHSGLGTLNHTLLSLNLLDTYRIPVLAVILNGPVHPANLKSLRRMQPQHRFLSFPSITFDPAHRQVWQAAADELWAGLAAHPPHQRDWARDDASLIWHPYTQHKTSPAPIPIVAARGTYLYTDQGEALIDASASWWTCSIGHGHPLVGAAIRRQQARLDHCVFAGATHQPAVELGRALIERSEGHLQRVFYSDNGSCAVEIALKMAAQSWLNRGQTQRTKFLYFKGAYHGDTFGAMSVADADGLHRTFKPYLFQALFATPVTSHPSAICPQGSSWLQTGCQELENVFQQHAHELAGVLIEPWLQGASGMNIQELAWLQQLGRLCEEHGVPLILDEVFTGMGRLGSLFAFLRAGLRPDIVCIAKGLTGGNLPLAVTLTRESVFEAFFDSERGKALLHGHTFTGHPVACAAALATLEVYERNALPQRALQLEAHFQAWLQDKAKALDLHNCRALGAMMAWELPGTGLGDYFHPLALKVPPLARRHGLMMRTLGNTVYVVPPLTISDAELGQLLRGIEACMQEVIAEEGAGFVPVGGLETPYSC